MARARSERSGGARGTSVATGDYEAAHAHAVAGRAAKAVALCHKILAADPTDARALHLLGGIALRRGQVATAEELVRKAIQFSPGVPEYHDNLGAVLLDQGKEDEAIAQANKAIELEPNLATAHNNLGNALMHKGDLEGAAAAFRRVLELEPGLAEVHSKLGTVYKDLGGLDEALACQEKALNLMPDFHRAQFFRALLLLIQGRFEEGWQAYLWRPSVRDQTRKLYPRPLPRDLSGMRIFLRKDQGLGDEIFFLRFAPELKNRGASIVYQADAKIAAIVERLPFIDKVVVVATEPAGFDPARFDMELSVGNLPYFVQMNAVADIPPPYPLPVDPERVSKIEARLKSLGPPPYIGVTWRAGLRKAPGEIKQVPLHGLPAVLGHLKATFLALQRNPQAGEIDELTRGIGQPVHDFTALNDDLEDMIALLSRLDDYVAVSNTNVHLRAGAGRTSRILVPHPPEYRWMAEGSESPWFPGCGVYRQAADGDWDRALAALAADLAKAFGP